VLEVGLEQLARHITGDIDSLGDRATLGHKAGKRIRGSQELALRKCRYREANRVLTGGADHRSESLLHCDRGGNSRSVMSEGAMGAQPGLHGLQSAAHTTARGAGEANKEGRESDQDGFETRRQ